MHFGISEFFRQNSKHVKISESNLLECIARGFPDRRRGYREGVVLVPIQAHYHGNAVCTSDIVPIEETDVVVGQYTPRVKGEEPRMKLNTVRVGDAPDAAFVDVVLYSREVLQEGGEDHTGADWDVIAVLGRPTISDVPMDPWTMMSNHFQVSGGTATHWSAHEFQEALRESFLFWRKHIRATFQK
jgi:hypothetical protein